jgi:hypothetical protein
MELNKNEIKGILEEVAIVICFVAMIYLASSVIMM